jgi:hypothetical protein
MSARLKELEEIKTDLEIEEDIPLHEKGWRFQRIGWALIFAFILAAAVGVFGDGIASRRTLIDNGVRLEYDRFYRHEARMEMKIHYDNYSTVPVHVSIANSYLQKFKIESILPEPSSSRVEGDRMHYFFEGSGPMDITFYATPRTFGSIKGLIGIGDKDYPISHFIYP